MFLHRFFVDLETALHCTVEDFDFFFVWNNSATVIPEYFLFLLSEDFAYVIVFAKNKSNNVIRIVLLIYSFYYR